MSDKQHNRGFSLIELMVGMLIAILSSIVVFQVFSVSERQKRTTTGASDAQSNGAIAFHILDRDIKMAGWGLERSSVASCTNFYSYHESTGGPIANFFASVRITDGGIDPDSISINYYSDPSDANFELSLTSLRSTMPQPSSELNVNSTFGCGVNSLAIVTQGGNCTLMQITQVQDTALKLQHNPGGGAPYNPTIVYQNNNGWPAYSTGATLQCFTAMIGRTYLIQDRSLALQQPDAASVMQTYEIAPEIIDLQAQYGINDDPLRPQVVTKWVNATAADGWNNLTIAQTARIKAVRIALVARSAQYEKPDTTGNCTTTTAPMVADWSDWATFDTTNYPADWQCYRYKVFQTVVPLRNIIWANV